MMTKENIKLNLYQKLQQARVDLQNMSLKKSGRNTFAKFSYYELADFLPAINEIFKENNLYSVFCVDSEKATLEIINAENPTEQVTFSSPTAMVDLKGCTAIQAIGAIHTYMKRYLYMNALEIVESDLLDAKAGDIIQSRKLEEAENTISFIKDVDALNDRFKFLIKNSKNTSWKKELQQKGQELGAIFNSDKKVFESMYVNN